MLVFKDYFLTTAENFYNESYEEKRNQEKKKERRGNVNGLGERIYRRKVFLSVSATWREVVNVFRFYWRKKFFIYFSFFFSHYWRKKFFIYLMHTANNILQSRSFSLNKWGSIQLMCGKWQKKKKRFHKVSFVLIQA